MSNVRTIQSRTQRDPESCPVLRRRPLMRRVQDDIEAWPARTTEQVAYTTGLAWWETRAVLVRLERRELVKQLGDRWYLATDAMVQHGRKGGRR